MNAHHIRRVEFLGGPEDGRLIEIGKLAILEEVPVGGSTMLPVVFRLVEKIESEGQELALCGNYLAKRLKKGNLQYEWLGYL